MVHSHGQRRVCVCLSFGRTNEVPMIPANKIRSLVHPARSHYVNNKVWRKIRPCSPRESISFKLLLSTSLIIINVLWPVFSLWILRKQRDSAFPATAFILQIHWNSTIRSQRCRPSSNPRFTSGELGPKLSHVLHPRGSLTVIVSRCQDCPLKF